MFPDSFNDTIVHLVARWQAADKLFLRQVLALLAEGSHVSPQAIADVTGMDMASVEDKLKKGRTTSDENGDITEVFGIMLTPTCHRIQVGEVTLYSCCALVAQMVSMILHKPITIESVDPLNGTGINICLSPSGVQSVDPESAVGILVATHEEQVLSDVRAAFCSHVYYSSDPVSAEKFAKNYPQRYVVTVDHFYDAARRLYTAVWERG